MFKAKPRELYVQVNNIIPLWRVVISNTVLEPYPKLSHVNKILKCRTKYCERRRYSKKVTKVLNKGCTLFENSKRKIESRLRGGCSRAP